MLLNLRLVPFNQVGDARQVFDLTLRILNGAAQPIAGVKEPSDACRV